jgi:site-specific DNA recombinase
MTRNAKDNVLERAKIRCAIYTRKSTDERLDMQINSLDSQRSAAEAFIASQKSEGWICLPKLYDDGGFSGGNLDRPAFKQMMADIAAGEIDCVVVYKVDRLSRSLMDFARAMETFDKHGVSFVSVTQQFNTTHSMGRLTLNILLSFAQFERDIIGERIRDKIAAQREQGLWCGGQPVLGYDVDRSQTSPKLVINAIEAANVREIFELYLKLRTLLPVVQELAERGWANKSWLTRKGHSKGGRAFDKCSVYSLLTNPVYVGKIRHKENIYEGQHEAIIDQKTFDAVNALLKAHGRKSIEGKRLINRHDALLKGLLYCPGCGYTMVHNVNKRKSKLYRYYVCQTAIKRGRQWCDTGSLPAGAIEAAVLSEIRCIVEDDGLKREVFEQTEGIVDRQQAKLAIQLRQLEHQLSRDQAETQRSSLDGLSGQLNQARRDDLRLRMESVSNQIDEVRQSIEAAKQTRLQRKDIAVAFKDFDSLWALLNPRERTQLLDLLIERVEFDRQSSALSITYHPTAIAALIEGGETA